MTEVKVEIKGLKELAAAFRSVDSNLKGTLRKEYLVVAAQIAKKVAGKVPTLTGHAAASVKPRASAAGASIAAGGPSAEYYPWLDFGGSTGKGHKSGVPWSGSIKRVGIGPGGQYLYPTIAQSQEEIRVATEAAIERAAEAAGFETKEGL